MKKYFKNIKSLPQIKVLAKKKIFKKAWNWLENGSEWGNTTKLNIEEFKNVKIIPRIFNYNSKSFASNSLLNTRLPIPLMIAPMGHLTQFHKDGEAELALGAQKSSTFITISALSRLSLKEIRKKAKSAKIFYQIYFYNNKKWVEAEIQRAMEINVSGFVLTVDSPVASKKYLTISDNYDARKFGRRSNFDNLIKSPYLPNWNDVRWLKKKIKKKPLIIKGIMDPHDAAKAFKFGADGIWVSNHGGRAFESNISSLEMLPKIRKKIGKKKLVIFDGGIRSGSDILKAIISGANIVSTGRPFIYGLIVNGSDGVKKTFELFKEEYFISKKLSGH
jgi:isopentenyl diphosphate isomerase/L-lactate dehydrogenase-like FMN-dependent dehydrogenase